MKRIKCKIFGHEWEGIITGVTHKRHPIGKCKNCKIPIVDTTQKVTCDMYEYYSSGLHKSIKDEINRTYRV